MAHLGRQVYGVLPRASRDAEIGASVTDTLANRAPLTIVRGPRGYGKTTAIVRWLGQRDDDDPVLYLRLSIEARIASGFWRLLRAALTDAGLVTDPAGDDRVAVCQALLGRRKPLILVIDDFHEAGRIEGADEIDEDLVELVRQNERLDLVVATRALRALETTGALSVDTAVIRPEDLALTPELVAALSERMGLEMTRRQAHEIAHDLGGWPAAIRSCIEDAAVTGGDARVEASLVDGYLATLLNDLQSEGLREFLLRTAVPEEFTASGVTAIVPGERGARDLRNMRLTGLLTVRRTDAGVRYGYPPAIREALVRILRESRPEVEREVHLALMVEAAREEGAAGVLRHACRAGEWDIALQVIEQDWASLVTSHQMTLIEAARAFPEEMVAAHPRLAVARAELPRMPSRQGGPDGQQWATREPAFLQMAGQLRAMDGFSEDDLVIVLVQWGVSAVLAGDPAAAIYAFGLVRERGLDTKDAGAILMGSAGLMVTKALSGEVNQALRWAEHADIKPLLSGPRREGLTDLVQTWARLAYALACVDGMTPEAEEAVAAMLEPHRRDDLWAMTVFVRGHAATVSGSVEQQARSANDLRAAMRHLERNGITESLLGTTIVELLVVAGMPDVAEESLARFAASHVSNPTWATVHYAQGRLREAIDSAQAALRDPRLTVRATLETNLVLARAHLSLGERTSAAAAFSRAVHAARATGQRRPFALVPLDAFTDLARSDESVLALRVPSGGERVRDSELASLGHARGNNQRGEHRGDQAQAAPVVDAVEPVEDTPRPAETRGVRTRLDGLDLLSDRELEVLMALRDHPGPAGIGAELGVSVNTAKTHLRSVYHKLGASGREEALRLSRRLLPPPPRR
ncbi:LuxR C-terminal-related transcriptional regulator [Georgenia sp. MJ206]|uniref:helix-turn-helix transcriptional regulator n=1 Tax=Georgenia wangjunii TaxID=3117730 RepID=UPI002F26C9FA